MAKERFPKAMYQRQLREFRRDLREWERQYAAAETASDNAWLAGRFAQRRAALELLRGQVDGAIEQLEQLPRLS